MPAAAGKPPISIPASAAAGDAGTWSGTRPPGRHRLQARATDERRLSQPVVAPWNAKGYLMNAIQEIVVEVES